MHGGFFAFRTLQHPARRAEMREAHLPVIEHSFGARRRQRRRDIDDMHAGNVAASSASATLARRKRVRCPVMPRSARPSGCTVGSGRLSIRIGAEVLSRNCCKQMPRLRDINRMRSLARRGRFSDHMPRAQSADENGVMFMFGGKTHIVGKGCGDMQVDAARAPLRGAENRLPSECRNRRTTEHRRACRPRPDRPCYKTRLADQ